MDTSRTHSGSGATRRSGEAVRWGEAAAMLALSWVIYGIAVEATRLLRDQTLPAAMPVGMALSQWFFRRHRRHVWPALAALCTAFVTLSCAVGTLRPHLDKGRADMAAMCLGLLLAMVVFTALSRIRLPALRVMAAPGMSAGGETVRLAATMLPVSAVLIAGADLAERAGESWGPAAVLTAPVLLIVGLARLARMCARAPQGRGPAAGAGVLTTTGLAVALAHVRGDGLTAAGFTSWACAAVFAGAVVTLLLIGRSVRLRGWPAHRG